MTDLDVLQPFVRDIEAELRLSGYVLVDWEYATKAGKSNTLRFYVDRQGGRITVDECAAISRLIEVKLDAADPIEESYSLEVSSPGLFRIVKPEKWATVIGKRVKLTMKDGRARIGHVTGVGPDALDLIEGNRETAVHRSSVAKLSLEPKLFVDGVTDFVPDCS